MKVTFEFTDEELKWICVTAQEGGSGYWAATELNLRDALEGHNVKVWDREAFHYTVDDAGDTIIDEERSTLLGTLTGESLRTVGDKLHGKFHHTILAQFLDDPKAVDAQAADCLVQVALFGEVIYG